MKHLIRIGYITLLLAIMLNFRWVHAATATLLAEPCDPRLQSQAQTRVTELFGSTESQPLIHCLNQPTLGLQVSYGRTNFAPMLPAVVLIGPKGNNVDVLAHEWVHAETSHRLGFLQRSFGLPTWIDEGLAMQVDHRADYNQTALQKYKEQPDLELPEAQSISNSTFFVVSTQGKLHYALANCAVSGWLNQNADWLHLLTSDRSTAINQLTKTFNECK